MAQHIDHWYTRVVSGNSACDIGDNIVVEWVIVPGACRDNPAMVSVANLERVLILLDILTRIYFPIHGPLIRYVNLRVAHAPGMPGTFSPPSRVSAPDMHHGTCVTHVPRSLTSGFLWSRRGIRSRHSQRMRIPQFYVSGKRPMQKKYVHAFVAPCFVMTVLYFLIKFLVTYLTIILRLQHWRLVMSNTRFRLYSFRFNTSTIVSLHFVWHTRWWAEFSNDNISILWAIWIDFLQLLSCEKPAFISMVAWCRKGDKSLYKLRNQVRLS